MPRLSVLFIRAALVYLALGFTFGALLLFHKGVPITSALWRLLPMHIEFVLFGWTAQLAMGVAFWILPRFALGSARGREWLAWLAFGLLNAGVLMSAVGLTLDSMPMLALVGRLCELAAVLAFAGHAWPRVKPLGA